MPALSDPGPEIADLAALRAAETACRRCPLYQDATQVVPGEGPSSARILLVGEQPGDREDMAGRPFVGPAGRILDDALKDAAIDRDAVFVTNAVKHFKHETRGKRRLHKRPNAYEIDRCNWWLAQERKILSPDVLVALGATAARGVIGRPVKISAQRGRVLPLQDGCQAIVTIHPSALLRLRSAAERRAQYSAFVADLAVAAQLPGASKAAAPAVGTAIARGPLG